MRDSNLLRSTLRAIRQHGGGMARIAPDGARRGALWLAGSQPLNEQAVQDLLADGWLRRSADRHTVKIDAWPAFAGVEPSDAGWEGPC